MAQRKKSSKKKNNPFFFTAGCVVLGLLIVFIIFLVKKDQIYSNLQETDFFNRIFGSTPEVIEKHENTETKTETIPLKEDVTIQIEQKPEVAAKPEEKENTVKNNTSESEKKETAKKETEKKEESKKEEKKESPKTTAQSEYQLCFVFIDGDGSVTRKIIKRSVPKSDSPLTNSINLLLKGPDTTKSAEKNCMTLIPSGTKLLSAKVSDGVAYLNFNENFEINSYGVEGYIHQLEQVVYTATAFSTVKSVQFLIEGEKRDYLGSEGQWIGSPLSRSSF